MAEEKLNEKNKDMEELKKRISSMQGPKQSPESSIPSVASSSEASLGLPPQELSPEFEQCDLVRSQRKQEPIASTSRSSTTPMTSPTKQKSAQHLKVTPAEEQARTPRLRERISTMSPRPSVKIIIDMAKVTTWDANKFRDSQLRRKVKDRTLAWVRLPNCCHQKIKD